MPLAVALTGCSEAPKLPGAPKSEAEKAPGPTAGAPAPRDEDKSTSGGDIGSAQPPPAPSPSVDDDVQESRSAGSTPTEGEIIAREEQARRAAEAAERWRQQQQQAAKETESGYGNEYGASSLPKRAEPPPVATAEPEPAPPPATEAKPDEGAIGAAPPPPPPPAPVTAAPTPSAPAPASGDGATIGGAAPPPSPPSGGSDGGASRGFGQAAKPPAAAAASVPPKAFDLVPVFYGTDRVVEPDVKRLQYGTERGHKLQLGRALVTVPDTHKVPNIERPWVVELPYFKYKIYEEKEDPAKHFTMQEIGALTKEQLLVYVKERLAKSTTFKDHAFVFVHGFNTSFDAAIYRTAQISYDLKFDGAPFVYSWPSGGKVASYTYDRGSAEQAEPHLAEFLDFVIKQSGAKSISLIAHSMGNEVLLRVLERMRPVVPKGVVISQVILAAPDVDRDKFTNIAREITNFAKGVTLYAASNDRALSYSARFWGGVPRAGDVPASGPLIVSGVDTIDVTALSTESLSLNHSGYAENTTLLNDIAQLLQTGLRPPDKREPLLQKVDSAAGTFWRYPAPAPRPVVK